jgi:hypothetical protein
MEFTHRAHHPEVSISSSIGADFVMTAGEFHDLGDAKWIVIRGKLRGHNNTPFGRPTPSRSIGHQGVGHPDGVFGSLSYYYLVIFFFNIVTLIMEFTFKTSAAAAARKRREGHDHVNT